MYLVFSCGTCHCSTAVDLLCLYIMLKFKVTTYSVVLEAKQEVSSLLLLKSLYLLLLVQVLLNLSELPLELFTT